MKRNILVTSTASLSIAPAALEQVLMQLQRVGLPAESVEAYADDLQDRENYAGGGYFIWTEAGENVRFLAQHSWDGTIVTEIEVVDLNRYTGGESSFTPELLAEVNRELENALSQE